jgi:hypothetical protein
MISAESETQMRNIIYDELNTFKRTSNSDINRQSDCYHQMIRSTVGIAAMAKLEEDDRNPMYSSSVHKLQLITKKLRKKSTQENWLRRTPFLHVCSA